MGNTAMWIVALVVLAALAVFTGFWAIDMIFKIVLYVAIALLAIWIIMMLIRAGKNTASSGTHGGTHV